MNLTKILLIILFFTLPLIHGGIFSTLWIDINLIVSGNFEFTKSIFFNILSALILVSFLIDNFFDQSTWRKMQFHFSCWEKIVWGLIIWILTLSTLFSLSPFTSLVGDDNKWHTALLFFNLLWIFIVLRNHDRKFLKTLVYTSLLSWVCASLIAIKELYSPSFNYGHLADRALGSFGHPNYLSGFLLLLLPFTSLLKDNFLRIIFIVIFWICILLTKSIVAVILAFLYISFSITYSFTRWKKLLSSKKLHKIVIIAGGLGVWILLTLVTLYLPEKLHSFLSRFYLWETTLSIIFSDPRVFLFWWWLETLSFVFENYKSPEVYIYENFWFTADRPHNFFLNVFYHFWIFWVSLFIFLLYSFIKKLRSTFTSSTLQARYIVILLFLLYGIIHFFSIASYLIVILAITLCMQLGQKEGSQDHWGLKTESIFVWALAFISLLWGYYSIQFYKAEMFYAKKQYSEAQNIFTHPKYLIALRDFDQASKVEKIESPQLIKSQIRTFSEKEVFFCEKLVSEHPSPENYFYCWDILEWIWNIELSANYYKNGISLLPNLWNEDSEYWNNYFIKTTISGNRFFSEKFSPIKNILEKLEVEIDS